MFQSVERRRTGCRSGEAAIRSREKLGKSGIVVNPVDRMKVVIDILNFARELGFSAEGITTVPDNFKNKNVEYLLYFKKPHLYRAPLKASI